MLFAHLCFAAFPLGVWDLHLLALGFSILWVKAVKPATVCSSSHVIYFLLSNTVKKYAFLGLVLLMVCCGTHISGLWHLQVSFSSLHCIAVFWKKEKKTVCFVRIKIFKKLLPLAPSHYYIHRHEPTYCNQPFRIKVLWVFCLPSLTHITTHTLLFLRN